jgi:hypothetical protein
MNRLIGKAFVYVHDIHYGYESGHDLNFTINSKEPITEDLAIKALLTKYNPKSIRTLKDEWKDYLSEDEFEFGVHSDWAGENLTLNI